MVQLLVLHCAAVHMLVTSPSISYQEVKNDNNKAQKAPASSFINKTLFNSGKASVNVMVWFNLIANDSYLHSHHSILKENYLGHAGRS